MLNLVFEDSNPLLKLAVDDSPPSKTRTIVRSELARERFCVSNVVKVK